MSDHKSNKINVVAPKSNQGSGGSGGQGTAYIPRTIKQFTMLGHEFVALMDDGTLWSGEYFAGKVLKWKRIEMNIPMDQAPGQGVVTEIHP